MLDLYHYSQQPLMEITQREIIKGYSYDEKPIRLNTYYMRPFMKPEGLWLSPDTDDNWYNFWIAEDMDTRTLLYKTHVKLNSDSNILILDTVDKMYAFRNKYKYMGEGARYSKLAINWQDVLEDYQGILIDPYHYSLRLHSDFTWYYIWDCSSACILDISAIQDFTCIEGG